MEINYIYDEEQDLEHMYKQIIDNEKDFERLTRKLQKNDLTYSKFLYAFDDINFALLTYNRVGDLYNERMPYNLLSLKRILIMMFGEVYGKITDIQKKNNTSGLDRVYKDIENEINSDAGDKDLKQIRNVIVHNIDYLYTDYFLFEKNFNLKKQIKLLNLYTEYLTTASKLGADVTRRPNKTINNRIEADRKPQFPKSDTNQQKQLIVLGKQFERQLVYPPDNYKLMVFDIAHKLFELGQAVQFFDRNDDKAIYWARASILLDFQLLDKIGKCLAIKHLNATWNEATYFKATVERLVNLNISVSVEEQNFLDYMNSSAIKDMRTLRNALEHKTEHLQYNKTLDTFLNVAYNFYEYVKDDVYRWCKAEI